MIRIAQFGTGNFLRAFADLYFDTLNREAKEKLYSITVIKPTPGELPVSFQQQNNLYTVCLRGVEKGAVTESIYKVSVLDDVINPFENINAFYALARDPELALILSNTTEAGIEFREDERYDDFQHSTFPSKLTKLLYARFQASLPGVCILPTELIDDNAQALLTAVESYSKLWGLPEAFNL